MRLTVRGFMLVCLLGFGLVSTESGIADHREGKNNSRRNNEHQFQEEDHTGNETAGQIAVWLLIAANFTVAVSLLTKGINRIIPRGLPIKNVLNQFNRFQKKILMALHYYLNPPVVCIALWHWLSSRCRSTALPEWGFLLMLVLICLGILLKFKLLPANLRKIPYRIHTHPAVFATVILFLTVGHAIVD